MFLKKEDNQVESLIPISYFKQDDLNVHLYFSSNFCSNLAIFSYKFGYVNKNISPVTSRHFACLSFLVCQFIMEFLNQYYLKDSLTYQLESDYLTFKISQIEEDNFLNLLNKFFEGLFNLDVRKSDLKSVKNKTRIKLNQLASNNYLSYVYLNIYNDNKLPGFSLDIINELDYINADEVSSFINKYILKNFDSLYVFTSSSLEKINLILENYRFINEDLISTLKETKREILTLDFEKVELNLSFKNKCIILVNKLDDFKKLNKEFEEMIYPILYVYKMVYLNRFISSVNKLTCKDNVISYSKNDINTCYDKLFFTSLIFLKDASFSFDNVISHFNKTKANKKDFMNVKNYLLDLLKRKSNDPSFIFDLIIEFKNDLINYNKFYNLLNDLDFNLYKKFIEFNKSNKVYVFKCESKKEIK